MALTNTFLGFADGSANVLTDTSYAALSTRGTGLASGIVPSNVLNKVLRQTSVLAEAMGAYVATHAVAGGTNGSLVDSSASDVMAAITSAIKQASRFPGMIASFAMNSPPTGWLECDGSAVSRTTYADLFGAIGTTYGVGDGSTTFTLPDLRGEFLRGWDHDRGVDYDGNPRVNRVFGSNEKGSLLIYDTEELAGDPAFTAAVAPLGSDGRNGGTDTQVVMGVDPVAYSIYPDARVHENVNGTGATSFSNELSSLFENAGSGVSVYYGTTRPRNVAILFCIMV